MPTQALFFLNDPFVHDQADRFAARLLRGAADDAGRIDLAYRLAYGRPATLEETRAGETVPATYAGLKDAGVPPDKQTAAAWAGSARVLFAATSSCTSIRNFTAEIAENAEKKAKFGRRLTCLSSLRSLRLCGESARPTHERSAIGCTRGTPCASPSAAPARC